MTRKNTSNIWLHFVHKSGRGRMATCNICKAKLSYKTSISNLKRHLQHVHPTIYLRSSQERPNASAITFSIGSTNSQEQIDNENNGYTVTVEEERNSPIPRSAITQDPPPNTASAPQQSIQVSIPKKTTLTQQEMSLMGLFIYGYHRFSMVKAEGFKSFVQALSPNYKLPDKKYISHVLLGCLYDECYADVTKKLNAVKSVCITTDHWTSFENESYLGVTAHFIDDKYKVHHILLECQQYEGEYTAIDIANALRNVLVTWKMLEKVLIVITDNASTMSKAVTGNLVKNHYGCFAHTLNVCVQNCLDPNISDDDLNSNLYNYDDSDEDFDDYADGGNINEVSLTLNTIKKLVSRIRNSEADEKLLQSQAMMGQQEHLSVINDVKTRWNFTFLMIERCLMHKQALQMAFANLNDPDISMLTEEEWCIAEQICCLLRPLEKATREMCGEGYFTASKIIPVSSGLINITQKAINEGKVQYIPKMANKLLENLKKRFGNVENNLTIASNSFLDPRFKQHVFSNPTALSAVQKDITDWVIRNIQSTITEVPQESQQEMEVEEEFPYWADFDSKVSKIQPSTSDVVEVQRYLSTQILKRNEDPLVWWEKNKEVYPNLSRLVQIRSCMVATSVPCERLFSKAGMIISERRAYLSSSKVNKLVFLNQNLKDNMT